MINLLWKVLCLAEHHFDSIVFQAEAELRHEKHTWLLQRLLYHELQELLLDYDLKGQEVSLASEDRQVCIQKSTGKKENTVKDTSRHVNLMIV